MESRSHPTMVLSDGAVIPTLGLGVYLAAQGAQGRTSPALEQAADGVERILGPLAH